MWFTQNFCVQTRKRRKEVWNPPISFRCLYVLWGTPQWGMAESLVNMTARGPQCKRAVSIVVFFFFCFALQSHPAVWYARGLVCSLTLFIYVSFDAHLQRKKRQSCFFFLNYLLDVVIQRCWHAYSTSNEAFIWSDTITFIQSCTFPPSQTRKGCVLLCVSYKSI